MLDRAVIKEAVNKIAYNGHTVMEAKHPLTNRLMEFMTAPDDMSETDFAGLASGIVMIAMAYPNNPCVEVIITEVE